jgi:azurin
VRSFVNGTNWRGRQLDIQGIVNTFLGSQDPRVRPDDPRLIAWSTSITSGNTPQSIALGQFVLAIDGQSPSVMEKIGLLMNVGETVTVRETT